MSAKYGNMTLPKFYCENFMKCQNHLPKFQPKDCKEQCIGCVDIIIEHHASKKKK